MITILDLKNNHISYSVEIQKIIFIALIFCLLAKLCNSAQVEFLTLENLWEIDKSQPQSNQANQSNQSNQTNQENQTNNFFTGIIIEPDKNSPFTAKESYPKKIADTKQIDHIRARILDKMGYFDKSYKIYQNMNKKYPNDNMIQTEMINLLFRSMETEAILYELRPYFENNQNSDQIKNTAQLWLDNAYASLDQGNWNDALISFQHLSELDPNNEVANQMIETLMKDHKSTLEIGLRSYSQPTVESSINSVFTDVIGHSISTNTRLMLHYESTLAERNLREARNIGKTTHEVSFQLSHQVSPLWQLRGGMTVKGKDTGVIIGFQHKLADTIVTWGEYANHSWTDPAEAAELDGNLEWLYTSANWDFSRYAGIYASCGLWRYYIDHWKHYGKRERFSTTLNLKFNESPKLYLNYSFDYGRFIYANPDNTPIPMIPYDRIHAISTNIDLWNSQNLLITVAGGARWDFVRSLGSRYIAPEINIRLNDKLQFFINYEFNTEAGTVTGGQTHLFGFRIKMMF